MSQGNLPTPPMTSDSGEQIKVSVRVRKLLNREEHSSLSWKTEGSNVISNLDGAKKYQFDRVFNAEEDNTIVYRDVAFHVIESALSGFNSTIFAYGQTASGKTHTMMGTLEDQGIIRLAVDHIFDAIEQSHDKQFLLRVSYVEIYNEKVTDLLAEPQDRKKSLKVLDDTSGTVYIEGLREVTICTSDDVFKAMAEGESYRKVGETNMNDRSSRSHTIFRIIIESSDTQGEAEESGKAIMVSHLNLVDLAGSERAAQTGAVGDRFREGTNINNSLMVLGQVISKLSDGAAVGHVPFRNSKLTRILKNSLGGNTKTAIVCTVTPAELVQTKSTLEFAARAKSIVQHAHVNEILDERAQMNRLRKEITDLQKQVNQFQHSELAEMNEQLARKNEDLVKKLQNQMLMSSWTDAAQVLQPMKSKAAKDRRMTWCPSNSIGPNRRMSFGGVLRLKLAQDTPNKKRAPETPETSNNKVALGTPDSPPRKRSMITTRRKKVVQFESICEDVEEPALEIIDPDVIDNGLEDVDDLRQTLLGLQAKLERDADHRLELEGKLEQSRRSSDNAGDKLELLETENAALKGTLEVLQANLEERSDKLQDDNAGDKIIDAKKLELLEAENAELKATLNKQATLEEKCDDHQEENAGDRIITIQKLELLESENAELKTTLSKVLQANLEEKSDDNVQHEQHVCDAVQKLTGLLDEKVQLEQQLLCLRNENNELQQKKNETHAAADDASKNQKLELLETENAGLKATLDILQANLEGYSSLQDDNVQLKQQVSGLKDEKVQLEGRLEQALRSAADNVGDNTFDTQKFDMLEAENAELKATLDFLKANLEEMCGLQDDNVQLKQHVSDAAQNISVLQDEKVQLELQLQCLRNEKTEQHDLFEFVQFEKDDLDERCSILNKKQDEASATIEALKKKSDDKIAALEEESLQMSGFAAKMQSSKAELQTRLDSMIEEKLCLEDKVRLLDSQGGDSCAVLEQNKIEVEKLLEEKATISERLTAAIEALSTHEEKALQMEGQVKVLSSKAEELAKVNTRLEEDRADLRSTLSQHEDKLTEEIALRSNLESKVSELQASITATKELEDKYSVLLEEKAQLEVQIHELEAASEQHVISLRDKVSEHNIELSTLREDLRNAEENQHAAFKSVTTELEMEVQRIKEIQLEKEELEDKCSNFNKELDVASATNVALKKKSDEAIAALEGEILQMSGFAADMEASIAELQSRLDSVLEEKLCLEDKVQLLNSQGGDSCVVLEQKQIEVEQLLGEKATLSDRLTAAIEALSTHEEKALQMEGQVEVLSSRSEELTKENMHLEENSAGTSKFIQNLRSTLIQHKEKLTEETALRSNLESKVLELQDYASASIEALKKKSDDAIAALEGKNLQMSGFAADMEASSAELQSRLDSVIEEKLCLEDKVRLLNSQGGDSCTVLEQKQIEVEQLLGEKATLSDRLTAAIEALSAHEDKNLQMEGQVEVLSSRSEELAKENMRLEENSDGTSKFIQNLRSTLIQHKEKLTEETALRSNLESKVSELQNDASASIEALKKKSEEAIAALEGEILQMSVFAADMEASSAELQSRLDSVIEEKLCLEDKVRLLNSQGGDSCTVLEQKQIEVEQLLGEKATLSDRLTAAIEALSAHEEKALQMEGQVDVLSSKAVELANENMRLEENSAGTSKFIQNLRSTLIQHKEKLTEETALRSNLESKVSELQASITATKELDEKYSVLQGEKAQLETQIQELEASSTGEYVKSLREKVSQQNIELATLRVELRKAEGNQHTAIKRVATELEGERGQVRRLKEEIRRLSSQRQPAKNLDSTYVAREPSRPPLADKPVTTCSNCQNQLRGQQDQTDKKPGLDEDAFMKHNGEGFFLTGCGAAKEMFLDQAKTKVAKLQDELTKVNKKKEIEVKHYHDTALKWKNRTLTLQSKVKPCTVCVGHVVDYNKA